MSMTSTHVTFRIPMRNRSMCDYTKRTYVTVIPAFGAKKQSPVWLGSGTSQQERGSTTSATHRELLWQRDLSCCYTIAVRHPIKVHTGGESAYIDPSNDGERRAAHSVAEQIQQFERTGAFDSQIT